MPEINQNSDNRERRVLSTEEVELRIADGEKPKIVGYAAKYNKWSSDLGGFREIIKENAFDSVVSGNVVALKNHEPNLMLGRTTTGTLRLTSNSIGLRFEIDPPNTTTGKDTVEEIRSGLLTGCSFSFALNKGDDFWQYKDDGTADRTITKIARLWDVGPVCFPAYNDTSVAVRSLQEHRPEPDITENFIRLRQRDPSDFIEDSFRTISISEDEGIKAVVGKLKNPPEGKADSMVVQSYLFDKDKWTLEKAQSWAQEHKSIEPKPEEKPKAIEPERQREIERGYRKAKRIIARNKKANA
jgi:HK97 family phage prohead protease